MNNNKKYILLLMLWCYAAGLLAQKDTSLAISQIKQAYANLNEHLQVNSQNDFKGVDVQVKTQLPGDDSLYTDNIRFWMGKQFVVVDRSVITSISDTQQTYYINHIDRTVRVLNKGFDPASNDFSKQYGQFQNTFFLNLTLGTYTTHNNVVSSEWSATEALTTYTGLSKLKFQVKKAGSGYSLYRMEVWQEAMDQKSYSAYTYKLLKNNQQWLPQLRQYGIKKLVELKYVAKGYNML